MKRHKRTLHSNFDTLRFAVRLSQGHHSYFRMGYGALEQVAARPWISADAENRR